MPINALFQFLTYSSEFDEKYFSSNSGDYLLNKMCLYSLVYK
ncbi:hypothetical protein FHS70_000801 [Flammeovirga yaeyamensis]|nr:hypothetical protein [Flammeovirga yaeyamensis]